MREIRPGMKSDSARFQRGAKWGETRFLSGLDLRRCRALQAGGFVGAHVETPAPTIVATVDATFVVTPVAGLYWNTSVEPPDPAKSQKSPPQNAKAKLE